LLRFLLDEDLPPAAAEIARNLVLDAVSVHEISRRGYSDHEQLRFAADEERIFVTRNRNDFLLLTVEFYRTGEPHPGVLITPRSLPNDRPERMAHALKRWADARADMPAGFEGVDFL
jgi:predicted nuclease of predicted toxin-antitoxin system